MTTRRYCGDCTIYIELKDSEFLSDTIADCKVVKDKVVLYSCSISTRYALNRGIAIDNPLAFDDYAHSVCSFMDNLFDSNWFEHDTEIPDYNLDYTDSGYHIRRKKEYTQDDIKVYEEIIRDNCPL